MGKNINIKHVMKLSKLYFEEKDIDLFDAELNKILDYINMLSKADTSILDGLSEDFDYDSIICELETGNRHTNQNFMTSELRPDELRTLDNSFDFELVKANAPEFDPEEQGSNYGYFTVPAVIE